ncbi:MAG: phosphonate ABC transporter ATP-binding protein [Pseudomonadota bacterium]
MSELRPLAVSVNGLTKTFRHGARPALADVSFTVDRGEMVALIGASGSGKSTLIRHLAGLTTADRHGAGEVLVLGRTMQSGGRTSRHLRALRAEVGVIFQQFNLVGRLSLLTNVLMGVLGRAPAWRTSFGQFTHAEREAAMACLDRVGLADQAAQRASTLSGGQQQRAAIARALLQGARIVLADEPIASLDPRAARRVMEILADVNQQDGVTVVVSLHQVAYAAVYCPRTLALREGELVFDGESTALTPASLGRLYGAESETLFLPELPDTTTEPAIAALG